MINNRDTDFPLEQGVGTVLSSMVEEIEVCCKKSWCMYFAAEHRAQDTKDWGKLERIRKRVMINFAGKAVRLQENNLNHIGT